MMTDQNKTHGVLTDQEIHDLGLIAMQAGWPNAEFARLIEVAVLEKVGVSRIAEDRIYDLLSELASIDTYDINLRDHPDAYAAVEAAVLAKAAPQSPVAPADERAFPGAPVCSVCSTLIGSAPTVSATAVHQVFHSNGSWEDIDADTLANCEDNGVETRTLYTAPTPPTSAADAERLDFLIENQAWVHWVKRDGSISQCQLWVQDEDENCSPVSGESRFFNTPRDAIDAAIAASKKESGDE